MKSLAILNECTFSPVQIKYLKSKFSNVVIFKDTNSEKLAIERIGQRNIIIMDQFLFSFSEKLLKQCKKLELIIVNTTAYDNLDISLLNKYGVKLANLRDYATEDVAETALSMMFTLNNHTEAARNAVTAENVNDIYPNHPLLPHIKRRQLKNQTVGIVGLGNIGQCCASMCHALGMKVLGFNRTRKYIPWVINTPLRNLMQNSDIILITLSYEKKAMDKIITSELLSLAKNDALLISIAHPNLIDLNYLTYNPTKFRGIGLDYLVTKPVRKLMEVRKNNIIVTPHLGSQSVEAIRNMTEAMIEAATSFSEGKPLYLIN